MENTFKTNLFISEISEDLPENLIEKIELFMREANLAEKHINILTDIIEESFIEGMPDGIC